MEDISNKKLITATRKLLRPLVRLLINNGITVKTFFDIAKEVYVDVAMKEFDLPNKKQSISRVSILTGLSRKEVKRIASEYIHGDTDHHSQNRAACVVSAWVRDPAYKHPALLKVEGDEPSFASLVKKYGRDIPVRAMLDELTRVNVVERVDEEHVRLNERSYVPSNSDPEKIFMLGTDTSDFIATIEHNISKRDLPPRFQRKVMYDNIPSGSVDTIKAYCSDRAQQLIEELDSYLAQQDRDTNPDVSGEGQVRTGVGIYYFEEELSEDGHEKAS